MVTTSLLRVGVYVLGWDTNAALRLGLEATPMTRAVSNVLNAGNEFTIHPSGQSEEK